MFSDLTKVKLFFANKVVNRINGKTSQRPSYQDLHSVLDLKRHLQFAADDN